MKKAQSDRKKVRLLDQKMIKEILMKNGCNYFICLRSNRKTWESNQYL